MQIDSNRIIKIIVIYLQQKYIGRHTRKILFSTTNAAHYKDKVFPYGECLHATIKYEVQWITCIPIKPNNMINIKCDLGFMMNVMSKLFLMNNYMMDQMIH